MYATVMLIKMKKQDLEKFIDINLKATDKIKQFKGFVSASYYVDREKEEFGVTAIYETLEDLEASRNSRRPELGEMMESIIENTYEVVNIVTS